MALIDFDEVDNHPSCDAPIEQHIAFIEQLYNQPYPNNKPRGNHGIRHAVRAMILGIACINLMRQLGIKDHFDAHDIKLIQIALLLHDVGRENNGQDLWNDDSATNIYRYLLTSGFPEVDAISVSTAMRNKDLARNSCYYKFKKDVDRKITWQPSLIPILGPYTEMMIIAIQFGDCIDVIRCKETFDPSRIDLLKKVSSEKQKVLQRWLAKIIGEEHILLDKQGDTFQNNNLEKQAQYKVNLYQKMLADLANLCPTLHEFYARGQLLEMPATTDVESAEQKHNAPAQDNRKLSSFSRASDSLTKMYPAQTEALHPIFMTPHAYIKAVRCDKYNFWQTQFSLQITRSPEQQDQFQLRVCAKDHFFSVDGDGITDLRRRVPKHPPEVKAQYSQLQSTSLITPSHQSRAVGLTTDSDRPLAGAIFHPENVLEGRKFIYTPGSGTHQRPYRKQTLEEAQAYYDEKVKGEKPVLFSNLELFIDALGQEHNKGRLNEVLCRLKWDSRNVIAIFKNNLASRLMAQDYKRTLLIRLQQQAKELNKEWDANTDIDIVYYLPGHSKHQQIYNVSEQQADQIMAQSIYHNYVLRKRHYQNKRYEFLLGLSQYDIDNFIEQDSGQRLFKIIYDGYLHIAYSILEKASLASKKKIRARVVDEKVHSPIYVAVERNHAGLVRELLQLEIYAETTLRNAALTLAASRGCVEVVRELLRLKEIAKSDKSHPLIQAAKFGHVEVVRLFLQVGADKDNTKNAYLALFFAAARGHVEVVKLLLQAGADKKFVKVFVQESADNDIGGGEETPLSIAARYGHAAVVREILQASAEKEPWYRDNTLLYWAAEHGKKEVVRELLEAGADANTWFWHEPCSPLEIATIHCHTEIIQLMKDPMLYKRLTINKKRSFNPGIDWAANNTNDNFFRNYWNEYDRSKLSLKYKYFDNSVAALHKAGKTDFTTFTIVRCAFMDYSKAYMGSQQAASFGRFFCGQWNNHHGAPVARLLLNKRYERFDADTLKNFVTELAQISTTSLNPKGDAYAILSLASELIGVDYINEFKQAFEKRPEDSDLSSHGVIPLMVK